MDAFIDINANDLAFCIQEGIDLRDGAVQDNRKNNKRQKRHIMAALNAEGNTTHSFALKLQSLQAFFAFLLDEMSVNQGKQR